MAECPFCFYDLVITVQYNGLYIFLKINFKTYFKAISLPSQNKDNELKK